MNKKFKGLGRGLDALMGDTSATDSLQNLPVSALQPGKYQPRTQMDQVALEEYISEYDIYVRPCQATDVIEIDTLAELQALDERYQKCTQEAGL